MTVKGRTIKLEKLVNDTTEEARARRFSELVQDVRPTIEEELDALDAGYEADIEALREKVEAKVEAPAGEQDKMDLILREIRLDRLERRYTAEVGRDGPSAERYREIVAGGDPLAAEAYESVAESSGAGLGYGLDSAMQENREARREASMTPEQHRASAELRALELDRESAVAMGEMAGPRGSSSRERFVKRLLEGRGLRAVHRDEHGWVSPDEAASLDAGA
jgi:hypothetical protein